jgi:hypothetical protein
LFSRTFVYITHTVISWILQFIIRFCWCYLSSNVMSGLVNKDNFVYGNCPRVKTVYHVWSDFYSILF